MYIELNNSEVLRLRESFTSPLTYSIFFFSTFWLNVAFRKHAHSHTALTGGSGIGLVS